MLVEQLRQEWRVRRSPRSYREALCFNTDQLELGAGTVLAKIRSTADGVAGDGGDLRLTALLSVAYGPAVAAGALGHIRAAIARRKAGDLATADLHLALSRLDRLRDPEEASRRLFMADGLMRAGVAPEMILEVLRDGAAGVDISKYSPDQPRVPAGSGRPSGEWTTDNSAAAPPPITPVAAPQSLTDQADTQGRSGGGDASLVTPAIISAPSIRNPTGDVADIAHLTPATFVFPVGPAPAFGGFSDAALARILPFLIGLVSPEAAAAVGYIAAFGLLVIPSSGPSGRWVYVGGHANISYYLNPDETRILLKFTAPDGSQHVERLTPDPDNNYRDPNGRILGRLVRAGAKVALIVSTAELTGNEGGEPQLCPAPVPDKYLGERGKVYENQMKALFNPGHPTPSGMAYYFRNPNNGSLYSIDDCQHQTGILAEYKGPGFEPHMIKNDIPWQGMLAKFLKQSLSQEQAAGDTQLIWFFAEESVADEMRRVFHDEDKGRERIEVRWHPMLGNAI